MTQVAPESTSFDGFVAPTKNFFHMPNEWIDICAEIDNLAELKVIQYVLRHTWGYQEFGITKAITVEEFMNGRKRNDGTRIDKGTGLKSDRSVKDGIKAALAHGYLICEVDATDKARIKKSYALKMLSPDCGGVDTTPQEEENRQVETTPQTGRNYPSSGQKLPLGGAKSTPRSEKDTLERHFRKTPEKESENHATEKSQSATPSHIHSQKNSYSQEIKQPTLLGDTPESVPSKASGYKKNNLPEPKPIKPLMPPLETKWCAEIALQIVEAKIGKYYRQSAREKQLNFAQRMFKDDPELTREQFEMAYDERNDQWWHDHKGLLHMQHMVEKDRVHDMLDKIEGRKIKPAPSPQTSKPKEETEVERIYRKRREILAREKQKEMAQ